jgi:hypothetical protein
VVTEDCIVYTHPDGETYVAIIGEQWWRWPAEEHGWQRRLACTEAMAAACWELSPRLARLALRLSGATRGDRGQGTGDSDG